MLTPCEVAVKTISPAIRALIAQNLLEKHKMNETQVANILGITQSAVSKYTNKVRGTTISLDNMPEVQSLADRMVTGLLANPVEQTELMHLFCQTCTLIRQKGLMCQLCQQNQKVRINNCDFCNQP